MTVGQTHSRIYEGAVGELRPGLLGGHLKSQLREDGVGIVVSDGNKVVVWPRALDGADD